MRQHLFAIRRPAWVILSLALFFSVPLKLGAEAQTSSDVAFKPYKEALAQATEEKKHVMIYFWTDWCGYCDLFSSEVLRDPEVTGLLADSFVAVTVDKENDQERLARKYRARTNPAVVFLDETGRPVILLPGYVPTEDFLTVLAHVRDRDYERYDLFHE